MELSPSQIEAFQVAKVFNDNEKLISCIDFDSTGSQLLTCCEDHSIKIYDARNGKLSSTIYSKKYGCALAQFTHKSTNIIYASTKEDDAIRYMSLYDNKFIRYFKGHFGKVVSLELSPHDDTFLSGSSDASVRLWDLKSPNSTQMIKVGSGDPFVAHDPKSHVFCVVLSNVIRLFDVRNMAQGPFKKTVFANIPLNVVGVSFSNDATMILVSTTSKIYLLDSDGSLKFTLTGHLNDKGISLVAQFTPDSQFVFCGSQDGKIVWWSTLSGQVIAALVSHRDPPRALAFNPKYALFASADQQLALWLPPVV